MSSNIQNRSNNIIADSIILLLALDLAVRAVLSDILVLTSTLKENASSSMEHSELNFEINLYLALTLRLVFISQVTISSFLLSILFNMSIIVSESCSVLMILTRSLCSLYIRSFNITFIVDVCCVGLL